MKRRIFWIAFFFAVCAGVTGLGSCSSRDGSGMPGHGDHVVTYEVSGGSGIIPTASITYTDANGMQQTIDEADLSRSNWTYTFKASQNAPLHVSAMMLGEGSTTLYVKITVDDRCWVDERTFVAGAEIGLDTTAAEILETCPNSGGTTEVP